MYIVDQNESNQELNWCSAKVQLFMCILKKLNIFKMALNICILISFKKLSHPIVAIDMRNCVKLQSFICHILDIRK